MCGFFIHSTNTYQALEQDRELLLGRDVKESQMSIYQLWSMRPWIRTGSVVTPETALHSLVP
jgi:hypothetical protein